MKAEVIGGIIGAVIVAMTLIASVTYYHVKKDEAIKSSVEYSFVKVIYPMAVLCALGVIDNVCIVYAASKK